MRGIDDNGARAPGLDRTIAVALLAIGWLFAIWGGFAMLDPKAQMDTRLAVLGMAAAYQLGAFMLAARARRSRWSAPVRIRA